MKTSTAILFIAAFIFTIIGVNFLSSTDDTSTEMQLYKDSSQILEDNGSIIIINDSLLYIPTDAVYTEQELKALTRFSRLYTVVIYPTEE